MKNFKCVVLRCLMKFLINNDDLLKIMVRRLVVERFNK